MEEADLARYTERRDSDRLLHPGGSLDRWPGYLNELRAQVSRLREREWWFRVNWTFTTGPGLKANLQRHTLSAPRGYSIAGISGSCGQWIDGFQIIITR